MRADRLLKMMMILQTKGRRTAKELANELEVSERTIYRDVIALSTAGVPIYSEKGPGGGILLVEDYRTSLTGLSTAEVHALFMLSVPAAMSSLGVSDEMKKALLKLSAALPASLREAEKGVRERILIDSDWLSGSKPEPHSSLKYFYQAVWEDRRVRIGLQYAFGVQVEHEANAYSLVNRGGEWYFICNVNGKFSVFPVNDIWTMKILEESFTRKPDFNLEKFWRTWHDRVSKEDSGFYAEILVTDRLLKYLSRVSTGMVVSEKEIPQGRFASQVILKFRHFDEARRVLLGYGGAIRVLSPLPLKYAVQDYARQTLKVYED